MQDSENFKDMKRGVAIILLLIIPLNIFAQIDFDEFSDDLSETGKGAWQRLKDKIGDMNYIGEVFSNITDAINTWWSEQAKPWIENTFHNIITFFNKKIIIE